MCRQEGDRVEIEKLAKHIQKWMDKRTGKYDLTLKKEIQCLKLKIKKLELEIDRIAPDMRCVSTITCTLCNKTLNVLEGDVGSFASYHRRALCNHQVHGNLTMVCGHCGEVRNFTNVEDISVWNDYHGDRFCTRSVCVSVSLRKGS